jgi:predicted phage tail protein
VALAAVVYWGGRLMAAAFANGFSVWLFAIGTAGIVGGVLAAIVGHWTATRQRNAIQQEDAAEEQCEETPFARTSFGAASS